MAKSVSKSLVESSSSLLSSIRIGTHWIKENPAFVKSYSTEATTH